MDNFSEEMQKLKEYEMKAVEQAFKDVEACLQTTKNHYNILKAFLKEAGPGTKVWQKNKETDSYERNEKLEMICNGQNPHLFGD